MRSASRVAGELSDRQGKVLRYVVTTTDQPVHPDRTINHIKWSDLPHSHLEALMTFESLLTKGLVRKQDKSRYTFTEIGVKVVQHANDEGMWNVPPSPSVTGVSTFKSQAKAKKSPPKRKTTRSK